MERFTIGRCRSGKMITSHTDLDGLSNFDEIFDAMAVLSLLASRAHRLERGSQVAEHLSAEAEKLEKIITSSDQWQIQMTAIDAKTSINIRNHAIRLLRPEFKE